MRRTVLACSAFLAGLLALAVAGPGLARASTGTSTLTGTVWNDANRNGVDDAGEAPFANIPINVYDGSTYVSGAMTDASGNYVVNGLADGTYRVEIDAQTWSSMRDTWVPTTTGSLRYSTTVPVAGSGVAEFGLRQVVRSTTMGSPMSTYTAPNGFVTNSYDDVLTGQALYDDLSGVQLMGAEAATTTLNFDSPSSNSDTISSVTGGPPYSHFHATMYVTFDSWVNNGDMILVHEYGHAWSKYNADITQQDPSFASYLKARGLTGDSRLSTSWMWEPSELIAEDYRQLFGTANAASYPQANAQLPPAADVPGLRAFLQNTFTSSSYGSAQPTAATVTAVSPSLVPSTGGTTVTVTGTGFSGSGWTTTVVHVGGATAAFTVVSPTQLNITLPAGAGTQDITVTTGSYGTSATSNADRVTYIARPSVTSLSPNSSSLRGGVKVTVTGTGFSGAGVSTPSVTFGNVQGTSVTVLSSTQLTVIVPAGASAGSVTVTVTTSGGSSATSNATVFTYKRK